MRYRHFIMGFYIMFFLFNINGQDYRKYSYKLFNKYIQEYNDDDFEQDSNLLILSDTANIIINIPVFSLLNPVAHENIQDGYRKLGSLIDYYEDYETQYFIIKKKSKFFVMHSTLGLSKRWLEYTKKQISAGNLVDVKIIPDGKIGWKRNYKFGYKYFSIEKLEEYINTNPQLKIFSIYNLEGLFCIKDSMLIRLDFDKQGLKEFDGEEYYRKNIINKGFDKIENIIIGGNPFWIK